MVQTLFCFILSFSIPAMAHEQVQIGSEMNGIKLDDYKDFGKWNLVTVRHREDTGELRFVYANDLAFNALKNGEKFPDGAVFAKDAVLTEEDKSFPNSKVPGRTVRYQIMVRDQKKYAATDGWGYALFQNSGKVMTFNPENQTKACLSCHTIVKDKQYVFSKIAQLGPMPVKQKDTSTNEPKYSFETVNVSDLSKEARERLPKRFKKARSLVGKIKEQIFFGTINEVRVLLTKEAAHTMMPAVLDSSTGGYILVIYPGSSMCEIKDKKGRNFEADMINRSQICLTR